MNQSTVVSCLQAIGKIQNFEKWAPHKLIEIKIIKHLNKEKKKKRKIVTGNEK